MMTRCGAAVLAACGLAFAAWAGAPVFEKEYVSVEVDGTDYAFYYPEVKANGEDQRPTQVDVAAPTVVLSYASGVKLRFEAFADHVRYGFIENPAKVEQVKIHLVMPLALAAKGATWKIADTSGALPKAKGPVKIFQGNAGDFALGGPVKFAASFPENYCWVELQDLRNWNWNALGVAFQTPYNEWKRVRVVPFGKDPARLAAIRAKAEQDYLAKYGETAPAASPKKPAAPTLATSLGTDGVRLACGSMGTFELSHPRLVIGGERCKPIETRKDGNRATLAFRDGGRLVVTLAGTRITYHLEQAPAGYKNPVQEMFVPITFGQGGKWHVDGKSGDFPAVKIGPKLFQGETHGFAVSDPDNAKLALAFTPGTWMEVQDNREWNWAVFWNGFHLHGGLRDWTVDVSLDTSAFARKRLLDAFGQVARDFPGKIKDAAELKADAATEDAYYKSLGFAGALAKKGYALDAFGGVAGGPLTFRKTGYFHCEQRTVGGKARWYLVDPLGNPFFHLGICSFGPSEDYTDVSGREDAFAWLPPREGPFAAAWKDKPGDWWNARAASFYKANVVRKYGAWDDAVQAGRYIDRVRAVGFNSIGAFSGVPSCPQAANFPYVGFVSLGKPRMIPSIRGMFDPFDAKSRAEVARAMKGMAAKASDPRVIGYFLANEQGLEDIPRAIPALDGTFAAKRAFVASLGKKYGTIAAFNRAWGAAEKDFAALNDKGLAVTTKTAFADVRAFTETFLEAYYSLIATAFRANDPNHLLIGSRWQPGTANDEILCRVCGKYMDVVSINYYAAGIDRTFVTRIYDWSGRKPQFWSEFYYTSTKTSNCGPSGFDLATQAARGKAYRNYVEGAAELGFVTGIEWFTLIDQAATGRFFEGQNGERANTGLFNVLDRPYKDLFAEMLTAHLDLYPVWFGRQAAWKFDDPRYNGAGPATRSYSIGHPVAPLAVDGRQTGYPLRPPARIGGDRLVMGREADGLEASFKGAWDKDNLYLLVTVTDKTPMCNRHKPADLWNGDGIEIFLGAESPDKGGPMLFTDRQILVGAAKSGDFYVAKAARQPAVKTAVAPTADGKGYTVECAIPWRVLDYAPKANDTLLFDLAVDDAEQGGDRLRQIMWNGSARNSSDRSNWGRLVLVP